MRPPAASIEVAQLVGEGVEVVGVARVGEVGGAVEEGVGLVVEGAADVELVDLHPVDAEPLRQSGREGGAGEHRGALVPQTGSAAARPRRAAPPAGWGWRRCPRPTPPGRPMTASATPRSSRSALVPTARGAGPGRGCRRVRRSGTARAAARTRSTRPRATVMRAGEVVGQAAREPSAPVGPEDLDDQAAGVVDPGGELVVGDDAPAPTGEVGEAAAGQLHAARWRRRCPRAGGPRR